MHMNTLCKHAFRAVPAFVMAALVISAAPALATEQARERQDSRNIRQDTRQEAAVEKIDCRLENNKSNAACRQDKRETKQDGREEARDARRGQ